MNMGVTDRPYFIELAKTKPLSRAEIIAHFDVSTGTAINWTKLPNIVEIEGSYPKQYAHRDYSNSPVVSTNRVSIKDNPINVLELPNVPESMINEALDTILEGEDSAPNFNERLRKASSVEDCDNIERMLVQLVVLNRYNRKALTD